MAKKEEKSPAPAPVNLTLTLEQSLLLYSFIFTTPAPSAGFNYRFGLILDQMDKFGFEPSDDGRQITTTPKTPKFIRLVFERKDLNAIKYAIALRLRPSADNNFNVPFGVARTQVWPLAEALGITRELKEELARVRGPQRENEEEEITIKLDSEYHEEELEKKRKEEEEANKPKDQGNE